MATGEFLLVEYVFGAKVSRLMSRILFPTTDFLPKLSGAATVGWGQAAGLARLGHIVRVDTLDFGPIDPALEIPQGLELCQHPIQMRPIIRLFPIMQMLLRAVQEFRPHYLYSTTYRGLGPLLALVGTRTRLRYALYIHGTELFTEKKNPVRRKLMEFTFRQASLLLTNSENTKRLVKEFFPKVGTQVVTLHPGIDLKKYDEPTVIEQASILRKNWLEQCGAPRDTIVLLTAARLTREKGIHRVLEALAELRRELRRPLIYVVCGSGPDLGLFREMVKELQLETTTLFVGHLSPTQLPAAYRAADIYVQPSEPVFLESFGISYVEAQYCGLPCIGTYVGGVPEAVRDGETAILVRPGDVVTLKERLRNLIENDELRDEMSRAARRHAAQFSWETHAAKLSELLERFCTRRGEQIEQ